MKTKRNQPMTTNLVVALSLLTLPAAAVAQLDGARTRHYQPATTRAVEGLQRTVTADGTVLYLAEEIAVRGVTSDTQRGARAGKYAMTTLSVDAETAAGLALTIRETGADRLAVFEGNRLLGTVAIRSIDQGTVTVSKLRAVRGSDTPTDDVSAVGTRIEIVPRSATVRAGQSITVDVYVQQVQSLRTFQVAVDAIAENGDRLPLETAETGRDRADHVFFGQTAVDAADVYQGRVGAVLFQGGADVEQARYLGSFTFATNAGLNGSYRLALRGSDTFLNNADGGDLRFASAGATVSVVARPSDEAIR